MSTEDGTAHPFKIDFLLIFAVLAIIGAACRGEYPLAILSVLGLIYIQLAAIHRAIEDAKPKTPP